MSAAPFTPAEPVTEPTIIDAPEWQTIVARTDDASMSRIRELMDSGFAAVGHALSQEGLRPAGAAFARYSSDPSHEPFVLELGYPLAEALDEPVHIDDTVVIPSSLPAGRVATVSHVGAYERLGESWSALHTWVEQQGHARESAFWEVYVTEPTPDADPESMRTDLFLPLRD